MTKKITITAKCSCGHEFPIDNKDFCVDYDECDCCGRTFYIDLTCPGCHETLTLSERS